ncbi:MAG: BlaI/MecI/CopY family transcriptional regulator [Saprospiraceae bacterium]|nr:BlaI/MecI/CopY family transcriptional regulator [Saprospiraceae bacterium]MBK7810222.1 BlaI/MecI/CopY family transcriptional regulator [Saprospiraceae bacterium]MBK9629825.1 BlaI/MecI/CopY family transcriptional regulator [Saprospiraceae bacterium]
MFALKYKPTESELDILQILWKQGPSTVKNVHEIILLHKDTGYTTTLKLMQIMTDKGLITRELNGKTHIYSALLGEDSLKTSAVTELVEEVFDGSALEMVIQTLGHYKPNEAELEEIKQLIQQLENKA